MFKHLDGVRLVYFVEAQGLPQKVVKIGYTEGFQLRFSSLVNQNAGRLCVLGVQPNADAERLEKELHERFAAHRDHSEWFRLVKEILAYIDAHALAPEKVPRASLPPSATDVDKILAEANLPPLMTVAQLAKFWKVSPVTIRRYVKRHQIPFVRVGGQLRFDTLEFTYAGYKHSNTDHTAKPFSGSIEDLEWSLDDDVQGEPPSLLTVHDVATMTGVSVPTVRRHVRAKRLPAIRVGSQLRFDVRDVLNSPLSAH